MHVIWWNACRHCLDRTIRYGAFLWLRKRSPGSSFLNQDTEKKSSVSERTVQCTLGTAAKYRSFLRHGHQATTPPVPPRSVVDRSGRRIGVRRCRDGCRRFNLTWHVSTSTKQDRQKDAPSRSRRIIAITRSARVKALWQDARPRLPLARKPIQARPAPRLIAHKRKIVNVVRAA
jgi:hypothetical protein